MNIQWIIIACVLAVARPSGSQVYDSCNSVLQQSKGAVVKDGEYLISVGFRVAVQLYCSGFKTGTPQTYLTLKAGRVNNYGSYYRQVGASKNCGALVPNQNYTGWGRTEFTKIKINPLSLLVDIADYKFSHTLGPNKICFGCAGDKFAQSYTCTARGKFRISLASSPFAIDGSVAWTWAGQFPDGSAAGKAVIQNVVYIGCFKDGADRLLPALRHDDKKLTVAKCIQLCRSRGYRYAGLEVGRVCFCGQSHDKYAMTKDYECRMRCNGGGKYLCGSSWRIAVYSTRTDQVVAGICGGYPGSCFPALKTSANQKALKLQLAGSQPCISSPCQNEATCLALTEDQYKCLCQPGYTGRLCNQLQTTVQTKSSFCPTGMQPELCSCSGTCTGARFEGDFCVALNGKPKLTCRYGDPGHVYLFNVQGSEEAYCPVGSEMVSCNYWDSQKKKSGNGLAVMTIKSRLCSIIGCPSCTVSARCKKYDCGCENNGVCSKVTGRCTCLPGYTKGHCQSFDFCSYYEDHNNKTACNAGDCQAIPSNDIRTSGGDLAGDSCIFPFNYQGTTFSKCVEENEVGPPFACSTYFDGKDDYIDLGKWSPGPVYSIAAWVKPMIQDNVRRTIIGGVNECKDFGLYIANGKFNAFFYGTSGNKCSSALSSGKYTIGQWYLVSVTNNGTHMTLHVNENTNTLVSVAPIAHYKVVTSNGLRIGGSYCCKGERFKGYIKAVKMWNRPLYVQEVQMSMKYINSVNSTMEAIYGGLVAHYELGHDVNLPCSGIDHSGDDWTVTNLQQLVGIHCNITRFYIPAGVVAIVPPYNGTAGGVFEVYALDIAIDGLLDGAGAGYRGGTSPTSNGGSGIQGESYSGPGTANLGPNRGGGGGGSGGNSNKGMGRPGAGGSYYGIGLSPNKRSNGGGGWPKGGTRYGDPNISTLYLGSGGGSGGNAADLSTTPSGGKGGSGGGAIGLYASRTVTVKGVVSVRGGEGQGDVAAQAGCKACPKSCAKDAKQCTDASKTKCWDYSGAGGGGSGGSVYITGQLVDIGHTKIWTSGGKGGFGGKSGCGGDGGSGRIHVIADVFKGYVPTSSGYLKTISTQSTYKDLSIEGQKLIIPKTTVFGNEVYLGCFVDSTANRHFYNQVGKSAADVKKMTPKYCITLCRNLNFKYAAVEYGKECFCDNGFNWNLKKPDSDCNKPCSGDKLQYCGSSYRMAIYGPHSFLLSKGYNGIQQQCQPWCVTADADTAHPKWGQCDLSSKKSTSYKINCQCPAGMMGAACDQNCQNGTWGFDCRNNCTCVKSTTAECNNIDGICHCKPGFTGEHCGQPCMKGFYGQNCLRPCNCKDTEQCSTIDGSCGCGAGWTGKRCDVPCPPTFYGPGCSQKCNCNQGSCTPESGQCNCDPGFKLPTCASTCDPFNFGPNCANDCDCTNSGCDRITGACQCISGAFGSRCEMNCPHGSYGDGCKKKCVCGQGGCDSVTGQCNCAPGLTGVTCTSKCSSFTYGQNCEQICPCEQTQSDGCDPVTGKCICKPGFEGNHCGRPCPSGLFGAKCVHSCSCRNKAPCDPVSGKCKCLPGFQGAQCEQACPEGKYGLGCSKTCPTCTGGSCSKVDGKCICPNGNCNGKCPVGFYGTKCDKVCTCNQGDCKPTTGECDCSAGWTGPTCTQQCSVNKRYGKGCTEPCNCNHGKCDFIQGTCTCDPGYTKSDCSAICPNRTYGIECETPCPYCAHYVGCDPVSGACQCSPGYLGLQCDQPCPYGFYGNGCKLPCKCSDNGYCNNVDGSCNCNSGYQGKICDQPCKNGTWGQGCVNKCDCPVHSTGCNKVSGLCNCKPGFTGVVCIQSCVAGLWGPDCGNVCACNGTNSFCNAIDGTCVCKAGFQGPDCALRCDAGTWGRDCSQTCQCSSHGTCDSVTGICYCLPGYSGKACQTQCKQDLLWGKNCLNPCNCNGHHCDHRNGVCECPAGKKGNHCEQDCESNYFGFQCAQICQCQNDATCSPVTGKCKCSIGWSGQYCDKTCPPGRYGEGCKLVCICLNGAKCDQLTGVCKCSDGFTGSNCSQVCTGNTWGPNCINKCSPGCKAGCVPTTGDCKCRPWTCLNGGTCGNDGICHCGGEWTDMYCTTPVGRELQTGPNLLNFSLSGGAIAGIAIAVVAVIVLVAALTGFIFKRKYTSGISGQDKAVKYDRSETVVIDSGLPSQLKIPDGETGFDNPLTTDPSLNAAFTEPERYGSSSDS